MSIRKYISADALPASPGVYRIVCKPTGECYVGGSANVRKRCYKHAVQLANGDHYSKKMQAAYRRHGADAFGAEVLDECDIEELSIREEGWIKRLAPAFNTNQLTGRGSAPKRQGLGPMRLPAPPKRTPVVRMTHDARYERRRQMSAAVAAGAKAAEVAGQFRVTTATVYAAIQEFPVVSDHGGRTSLPQ